MTPNIFDHPIIVEVCDDAGTYELDSSIAHAIVETVSVLKELNDTLRRELEAAQRELIAMRWDMERKTGQGG